MIILLSITEVSNDAAFERTEIFYNFPNRITWIDREIYNNNIVDVAEIIVKTRLKDYAPLPTRVPIVQIAISYNKTYTSVYTNDIRQ